MIGGSGWVSSATLFLRTVWAMIRFQVILNNQLPLNILLTVMVFKSLALLVSVGSAHPGLLAPMFIASAAMAGISHPAQHSFTGLNLMPGAFALAAMAAVGLGCLRSPLPLSFFRI